jgi:hypothetical protein
MTLQQKLDDFKSEFDSGGPPYNAPKAVIGISHPQKLAGSELKILAVLREYGISTVKEVPGEFSG